MQPLKSILYLFAAVIILASACSPAKNHTYLNPDKSFKYDLDNNLDLKAFAETKHDYTLQSGDIISIDISSLTPNEYDFFSASENELGNQIDPLLSGYLVDQQGQIVLPHIGSVSVSGLTVRETQEAISKIISEYLDSPQVYVRLISFHYTLLGEVEDQGKYSIYEDQINILEALGSGGGLTEYADFTNVRVMRSENGVTKVINLNLLSEKLPTSDYYYLQPNDIVIVGQLKTKNFRRNSSSNIGLILSGIATIATVFIAFDRL